MANLGLEASLSVVISALIYTVVKIVEIRYGNMAITHLTSRPYMIAVFLFACSVLELVNYLIATNVMAKNDYGEAARLLLHSTWFKESLLVIASTKYALTLIFLISRIFEHGVLLIFINYQGFYMVQKLDIVRETYQRYEKRLSKLYYLTCLIISIPVVGIYIA